MAEPSLNGSVSTGTNYDSEFCGSLPLQFINLVQPHGLLLVVEKESNRIRQVSDNLPAFFGLPVSDFLNQPLTDFLGPGRLEEILVKIEKWQVKDRIPVDLVLSANNLQLEFNAIFHFRDEFLLLELEPERPDQAGLDLVRIYQEIKYIMAAMKKAGDLTELGQIVATEIKRLSGFDRVMLYRFDAEWNGTVVAEAREDDLEPYLHLRFPASDVPRSARELYFRNPFRLIPDRDTEAARLHPVLNPITSNFTDLSDCNLRGVPGVHVEYLRNMGVQASMSTSILKENRLWGLISCHHKSARHLSFAMRSAFELLSPIVSAQLSALENEQMYRRAGQLGVMYQEMLAFLYDEPDFRNGLLQKRVTLLDLFSCTGAAIVFDHEIKKVGDCPTSEHMRSVVRWLQRNRVHHLFDTASLSRQFELATAFAEVGSGLLALPISMERGEYILAFRPEVVQTVAWGGNPNESIQFEPDGKTYHPRNSFAVWQETVKQTASPWTSPELSIAESLRTSVLQRVLRDSY